MSTKIMSSSVKASGFARSTFSALRPHIVNLRWTADAARNGESRSTSLDTDRELSQSVPVDVAHELLIKGRRYLDVRTHDEFNAGHAPGAMNIPYMFRDGAEMSKNPQFLEEVSSRFAKEEAFMVGCQSGRRSLMAAADLHSAGFGRVSDVAGGYTAWMRSGLPTTKRSA